MRTREGAQLRTRTLKSTTGVIFAQFSGRIGLNQADPRGDWRAGMLGVAGEGGTDLA